MSADISCLPEAVTVHIFGFCDPQSLASVKRTCQRWRALLSGPDDLPAVRALQEFVSSSSFLHVAVGGDWKHPLYLAVRKMQQTGRKDVDTDVDLSSIYIPSRELLQVCQYVVTDGNATALFDHKYKMVKGVLPPAMVPRGPGSTPPGPAVPPGIRNLIGLAISQLRQTPNLIKVTPRAPDPTVWPPVTLAPCQVPRRNEGVLILQGDVDRRSTSSAAIDKLLSTWPCLSHLLHLDISRMSLLEDREVALVLASCVRLHTFIADKTQCGSVTMMMLGTTTRTSAPACCPLRVLSLAECVALQDPQGSAMKLLQAALTRLPSLEELTLRHTGCGRLFTPPLKHDCSPSDASSSTRQTSIMVDNRRGLARMRISTLDESNITGRSHHGGEDPQTDQEGCPCPCRGSSTPEELGEQPGPHASSGVGGTEGSHGDVCLPWLSSLTRLRLLDVSYSSGWSAGGLRQLMLSGCPIRILKLEGCKELGKSSCEFGKSSWELGPGGRTSLSTLPQLPSFHSLSLGWGFGVLGVRALVQASPFLVRMRVDVGGQLTDGGLQHMAKACPHLQFLELVMCPVSGMGVNAVLRGCPKLHHLHLVQCVGPFGPDMVADLTSTWRWGLSSLRLEGGYPRLTSQELEGLLVGGRVGARPLSQETVSSRLHSCSLVGLTGAEEGLLAVLSRHGQGLRHLRLERCSLDIPVGDSIPVEVLELLRMCTSLETLQLRHTVALPSKFLGLCRCHCPLMKVLVVDLCDLVDGGFDMEEEPYGALEKMQVYHCHDLEPVLLMGGSTSQGGTGPSHAGSLLGSRKVDHKVMTHDLKTGQKSSYRLSGK